MTTVSTFRPPRAVVRRDNGNWAFESALGRKGLGPVAGVDEAGRGACAGPLVVAACVLRGNDGAALRGLTDSKLLTPAERETLYVRLVRRAVSYSVIVIPAADVDRRGVHVANLEGMRRAVAALDAHPGYVLTDGFAVPGLPAPSIGVVSGDRVAACVAGASVLAKVTRDRIMVELAGRYPGYGFAAHKGYGTRAHADALREFGPCAVHRWSFANVATAAVRHGRVPPHPTQRSALSTARGDAGGDVDAPDRPDVVQNGGIVSEVSSAAVGGARKR